jgi:Raf kinase inhibitor-like YbhB/YbcL family protein
MKRKALFLPVSVLVILCLLLAGCTEPSPGSLQNATGENPEKMVLQVGGLTPGSSLPAEFTCDGAGLSPPVNWTDVPAGTQSLVLILDDPDAPRGVFTHWIVYDIPPLTPGIPANVSSDREIPGGGFQGLNSFGNVGYAPPCPPDGSTHRYVFQIYALDTTINGPNPDRSDISAVLSGHAIGEAQVVMMFGR